MFAVVMGGVDFGELVRKGFEGEEVDDQELAKSAMKALHGKTASAVIAEADRLKKERDLRTRARALEEVAELKAEIATLEATKKDYIAAVEELKAVSITNASIAWKNDGLGLTMTLTVTNGLDFAIARLYMRGTLQTPGRSVPWVSKDINYRIPGGLEPQESQTWRLAPNYFTEWGNTPKEDVGAVLTIDAVDVEGADRSRVIDSDFDEEKLSRLVERLKKLEESLEA